MTLIVGGEGGEQVGGPRRCGELVWNDRDRSIAERSPDLTQAMDHAADQNRKKYSKNVWLTKRSSSARNGGLTIAV